MESVRAAISVLPSPLWAGQSHVEILDSNRACESAAGFQSCAHDPISIPMLRPFAENWPHAIALGYQGMSAILLADIGGSNSRFALANSAGRPERIEVMDNDTVADLEAAV